MILHFTNINKHRLAAVLIALTGFVFSGEVISEQKNIFYLPNKTGRIFWKCDHDSCNTFLKVNTESTVVISEKSSSPSITALNKNLVRLFFSCGAPCNYTIFNDSNKGVSRAFEFVVALDTMREIVVIAENNRLVGYKIFDNFKKPLFSIKRNWSPTATLFSNIIEAKFIDHGLYVKYLEGDDFNEKEETFHNLINQ